MDKLKREIGMKRNKLALCILSLCVAGVASADTDFLGGNLLSASAWSDGLPVGQVATINTNGYYNNVNQVSGWLAGSTATFGGGATFTLRVDFAVYQSVLVTVNDATINCSDDFFVQAGNVVLNEGSVTTATDDWEANNNQGRITVNGGTHSSGTNTGHNVGAQKVGCRIDFLGGTVTAGNFRFNAGSTNSVGGSAILASAGPTTTFSSAKGVIDIASDWTGSWEVGSFGAGEWETRLTDANNGFLLDGATIDATSFTNNFAVSGDGTTLSIAAVPPVEVGDISIATLPDGDIEISWNGADGYTYALEYKNDLTDSNWLVYTNVAGIGTITVTVDGIEPETFYQVTGEKN